MELTALCLLPEVVFSKYMDQLLQGEEDPIRDVWGMIFYISNLNSTVIGRLHINQQVLYLRSIIVFKPDKAVYN